MLPASPFRTAFPAFLRGGGSLSGEDSAASDNLENPVFFAVDRSELGRRGVVEAAEMKHAMKCIKQELVPQFGSLGFTPSTGFGDADDDFAGGGTSAAVLVQRK